MNRYKQQLKLEGNLADIHFPVILWFLYQRGATGRLVINRGELTKVVFMVEGKPVNVDSTLRDETLGRYLIKKGRISEQQYEDSIRVMIEHNIQQGAALVKADVISAKELYHEVKAQTREKLLSCFAWTAGSFNFYPEVDFVEDIYRFEMPAPRLMREGIIRFLPKGAVESQLAKVSSGPIVPLPEFQDSVTAFGFTSEESRAVMMIDGESDVLALKKRMEEFSFGPKIVYLLLACKLAGPGGRPDESFSKLEEQEWDLPPIEEFIYPQSGDYAPEVVEEEDLSAPEEVDLSIEQEPSYEAGGDVYEEDVITQEEFMPSLQGTEEEISVEEQELEQRAAGAAEHEHGIRDESELLEAYMGIKSLDFYSLLGLSRDAGDREVEGAYRALRRKYDKKNFPPDISAEATGKLEEIQTQLIRAYENLRTGDDREAYLQRLEQQSREEKPKEHLLAEQCLQKGIQCVRQRDWAGAQDMFEKAVEAKPSEPEYYGYLGWSIYSNRNLDPAERTERAKDLLAKAIDMNPHMDSSHVFMGKLLKQEGAVEGALREFRAALQANPACKEAERELANHEQGEW